MSETRPSDEPQSAGEPTEGDSNEDEPTDRVCFCNVVDAPEIFAAIAGGARTVDAIGNATLAGTGCGGCRPDLELFLAATGLES